MKQPKQPKQPKQLKQSELLRLRKEWYVDQKGIDPVLNKLIAFEDTVLDHMHTKKNEEPDIESGKGFCRGVLDRRVNSLEGRILKAFLRSGLNGEVELPEVLINLGMYLNNNRKNEGYVHPTSVVKGVLTKRCYNKLVKEINGQVQCPAYGKGKLTKGIEKLFKRFNVEIHFYGG